MTITGASTYGGTTTIVDGTLQAGAGVTNALPAGTTLSLGLAASAGGAGAPVFDLNGTSQTVAGLAVVATYTGTATITNSGANGALLTYAGTGASTFSGTVAGGTGHTLGVAVSSGTLTLSGTNTYSGGTTVGGGTLITGSSAAVGVGAVTVNNGGTLNVGDVGGTPTVGALTLNGTAGALTLNSGGILTLTLANGGTADQISGGATLTLAGTLALNTPDSINYGDKYQLFTGFTGSLTATGLTITGYDNTDYSASLDATGLLSFTPTVVPEPSTWVSALMLSGAAFGVFRRRYRSGRA